MSSRVPAAVFMAGSTFLFATMGVCVKYASAYYDAAEIVLYRSLVGVILLGGLSLWRGQTLATQLPGMHFWRSLSGVISLSLWFYAISKLPLATAMTLNYMSSIWMAMFLIGGAVLMGGAKVDWRLTAAVLLGFVGVALVLRPTIDERQLWHGLAGLASGMIAAMAYLQVTALGRSGEPVYRVVFYFSLGGVVAGALMSLASEEGFHAHTLVGAALLLGVGLTATAAQMLMTKAYARGKPLVNACLQYLGIVYAFIFGALLFGDALSLSAIVGMVLIVVAGLGATLLRGNTTPRDAQNSTLES